MKRLLAVAFLSRALAPAAFAGEETVSYKSGEESVASFLVTPAGPGQHPAVIVI